MSKKSVEKRRAKAAEVLADNAKSEKRSRNLFVIGMIVVVAALIVPVILYSQSIKPDVSTKLIKPSGATKEFGIKASAKDFGNEPLPTAVDMVIYEDLQCPVCKLFESGSGDELRSMTEKGEVNIEYRMVSFLDNGGSKNNYSRRSASAGLCVRESAGTAKWLEFKASLFENQPDEGTEGPSNNRLLEAARKFAPDVNEKCIRNQKYVPWMAAATTAFNKLEGITATPTVLIEGEKVEFPQAVDKIREILSKRAGGE